ncbi:unnamed protein product, partial [Discosporangium mesarthrocarpum]
MTRVLQALSERVGDRATSFLPRTWFVGSEEPLGTNSGREGHGLRFRVPHLVKRPDKDLGKGISVVKALGDALTCGKECLLQRYVSDPLLLDGKKFSFGVYLTVASLDPLVIYTHREMLVLLCT